MEGERLHVAIIEQVNLRELGSTTLGGLFFTGSGSEADFLDAGCATAAVNTPERLAQILRGECRRDDTQSGTLTAWVMEAYAYAARLYVRNDDWNLITLEAVDDVLGEILLNLDAAGYRVVMHIHDEVVVEVPITDVDTALKDVNRIMTTTPEWLEGLPLAAETFISPHYTK